MTLLLGMAAFVPRDAGAFRVGPANDYFSNATTINPTSLPFGDTVLMDEATTESGEPLSCTYSTQTVWYKLSPTADIWVRIHASGGSLPYASISAYRDGGGGLYSLYPITCASYGGSGIFLARAGTTYYLQSMAPCCGYTGTVRTNLEQIEPPVPIAAFSYSPFDPSVFENVQFYDQSFDPGQVGIRDRLWDYGDGTANDSGYFTTHRFAADQDYTVRLTITTFDGRTASVTRVVPVRTHDVAITQFQTPQSASMGQTRQITVGIRNSRNPETVRVELYRSQLGYYDPFELIGRLDQFTPVRPSNRTTDFDFSYTFTEDDVLIGKVTFRAVATIMNGRDALQADNVAISLPTKVGWSGQSLRSDSDPGEEGETAKPDRLALLGVTPKVATAGSDLAIRLALPADGAAKLQVVDVTGRVVTRRDLGSLGAGIHETRLSWERRPAPGTYWVRLVQGGASVATRVAILW